MEEQVVNRENRRLMLEAMKLCLRNGLLAEAKLLGECARKLSTPQEFSSENHGRINT